MRVPLELFTAEGEALQIFTDYRSLITARSGTRRDQENVKLRPTRAGNEGGGLTLSNGMSRYLTHEIFRPHNSATPDPIVAPCCAVLHWIAPCRTEKI